MRDFLQKTRRHAPGRIGASSLSSFSTDLRFQLPSRIPRHQLILEFYQFRPSDQQTWSERCSRQNRLQTFSGAGSPENSEIGKP